MYTFPDTGGEVISSFALVAIFTSIVTAKAPYQLTQDVYKRQVQVFEYRRRPLHGKVALMDDHWATV